MGSGIITAIALVPSTYYDLNSCMLQNSERIVLGKRMAPAK